MSVNIYQNGKLTPIANMGSGVVDSEMSTTSENALQNKVVTGELNKKIDSDGDISETTSGITASTDSYPEISENDTIRVILGKIRKFFSDLRANKTDNTNVATVEGTTTASKAYKVGDLLIYDGVVYKVTLAIASGGAITVGANVTATTIADNLGGSDITLLSSYNASPTDKQTYNAAYQNARKQELSGKKYAINSGSWSSSTTTINSVAYYTYTLTLTYATGGRPSVSLAEGSSTLPTSAEKTAYGCVDYMTIDDSNWKTLKLYATTKPSTTFYIFVKGCGGEL